jgi:tripartite ATP-independent transporter DctP family solute receptor
MEVYSVLKKNLFLVISALLLVVSMPVISEGQKDQTSSSSEPIEIKFATAAADNLDEPYTFTIYEFKKAIEQEMPGRFDVKIFPNRQLGDEKENLEGLSFGTVDMTVNSNAIMANVEPAFLVNDLPFLYASDQQAYDALDGKLGQMLSKKMEQYGVITLGYASGGYRNMINNVRPIVTPDDVAGIKWRVMPSPLFLGMFAALKGNAIPTPWAETYTAMQQGTVDGMEIPISVIYTYKFAEITKYMSLTNHTYNVIGVNISKKLFDSLTPKEQKAIQNAVNTAVKIERAHFEGKTGEFIELLKADGMEVNAIKDPRAFRDRMSDLYTEFRPKIGADVFDAAMEAVK